MKIKMLVEGGKANIGPYAPTLAPLKIDMKQLTNEINEKTKEFDGMEVPVEVDIKEDKSFEIKVGLPPVSALIKKELNVKKFSKAPWGEYKPKEGEEYTPFEGNITLDQIVKIARAKMDDLKTKDFKKAVKQVVSACLSMGITIDEKNPKEIIQEIDDGKYDDKLK